MKKRLAVLALGIFALGAGVAHADQVATPIGTAYVNEGGYAVFADGDAGNPDPVDGYASVSDGGTICADDNGGWGSPGTSPTCSA